jgi:hypothetical protein
MYHGGAVLPSVEAVPVFYGRDWSGAANQQEGSDLTTYLQYLVSGPYMNLLNEYGVGRGTETGTGATDSGIAAGQVVDDSQIQTMLGQDIAAGTLPTADANRLYVVYTQPNVEVTLDGQNSATTFAGYHNSFTTASGQDIVYAVVVNPVGNGDLRHLSDFQTLTAVTSHEVAEAVTDPNADAWYDGRTGEEIGDLAQRYVGLLNGYAVQAEWSQQHNAAILPTVAQPLLSPSGSSALILSPSNLEALANTFTHSTEAYRDLVTGDYEQYLGRAPDAAGLDYWTTHLQQGLSDEQLAASLLTSGEYLAAQGGAGQDWVTNLYQNLLSRTAAATEVSSWLSQLAAGASSYQVALQIATSPEHESLQIRNDYSTYLGRAASAAEVSADLSVLANGVSNETLVASILGSQEYYNNPQRGNLDPTTWVTSGYQTLLRRTPTSGEVQTWVSAMA